MRPSSPTGSCVYGDSFSSEAKKKKNQMVYRTRIDDDFSRVQPDPVRTYFILMSSRWVLTGWSWTREIIIHPHLQDRLENVSTSGKIWNILYQNWLLLLWLLVHIPEWVRCFWNQHSSPHWYSTAFDPMKDMWKWYIFILTTTTTTTKNKQT